MKTKLISVLVLAGAVALSACATAPAAPPPEADVAGFWSGLWHGLTIVFAFIGSLFNDQIGIYETVNNGGWYDFGFALGTVITFGGASQA